MGKVQLVFPLLLLFSLATASWAQSGSGIEAYRKAFTAPQGFFAIPDLSSKETVSKNPDDIKFLLYTDPRSTNVSQVLNENDPLSMKSVSRLKPTVILVHDFLQDATTNFPRVIKDAYLKSFGTTYDIIVMDWGRLATPNLELPDAFAHYLAATRNVRIAGERLGWFLEALDNPETHLVGHGLGAHVAGFGGIKYYKLASKRVERLSALDPFGNFFESGVSWILRTGDAHYVDSYHTGKGGLGFGRDTGDADFYINGGGPDQPGCGLNIGGFCGHWRSVDYWRQSIENATSTEEPLTMCACRKPGPSPTISNCCEEMAEFGQSATPNAAGTYFVNI